jgi:hypothetical protein
MKGYRETFHETESLSERDFVRAVVDMELKVKRLSEKVSKLEEQVEALCGKTV